MNKYLLLYYFMSITSLSIAQATVMRKFQNNKLWRDKAVSFMESTGCKIHWRTLDDTEYEREIRHKLLEEAYEVVEAKNRDELINELADLQETICALSELYNISAEDITAAQTKKRDDRGGFQQRQFVEIA